MSQYQAFYDWNECTLDEEYNELIYKHIDELTFLNENNYTETYTAHYNISLPALAYKPGDIVKYYTPSRNQRTIPCPFCKGTGKVTGYNKEELTCPRCNGTCTEFGYVTYTLNTKTNIGYWNEQWSFGKIMKINFHLYCSTNYWSQKSQTYSTTVPENYYSCDYIIEAGKTELINGDNNKEKFSFSYNAMPDKIPHKAMSTLTSRMWYDSATHEYKLFEYISPNGYSNNGYNHYDGYMVQLNTASTQYENDINDKNYRDYIRNNQDLYIDDNHNICAFCIEQLVENEGG